MPGANVTLRIPQDQIERVRKKLSSLGMREREVKNTLWSLQKKGLYANMYPSGVLLLQGKGAEDLSREVLKVIEVPAGSLCGCDEAGKGDLFGPLVLTCCVIDPSSYLEVLSLAPKDSKRLTDGEILNLSEKLKRLTPSRSIVINPERFNELYEEVKNINRIMDRAYRRLIEEALKLWDPDSIIVDAYSSRNPFQDIRKVKFETNAERHVEVSCASIIARGKFLKGLESLGKLAGLDLPKGASPEARHLADRILKTDPQLARKVLKISFVGSG